MHINLRRGQADARRGVHGFGHIRDQGANRRVYQQNGRGNFPQTRVRETQNGK
jgi:hypothetical protein